MQTIERNWKAMVIKRHFSRKELYKRMAMREIARGMPFFEVKEKYNLSIEDLEDLESRMTSVLIMVLPINEGGE
jgi:hypothetical protein